MSASSHLDPPGSSVAMQQSTPLPTGRKPLQRFLTICRGMTPLVAEKERGMAEMSTKFRVLGAEVYVEGKT
jgi:hypothetical protein